MSQSLTECTQLSFHVAAMQEGIQVVRWTKGTFVVCVLSKFGQK